MSEYIEAGVGPINACVAAFTLHENQLSVIATADGGECSLPRAAAQIQAAGEAVDQAASEALTAAFGSERPSIEPIIGQSSSNRRVASSLSFGYAAVARLVNFQGNERLRPMPLQSLAESAAGLSEAEIYFVDKGIKAIRPIENGDWNTCLDDYAGAGPDFTLRILSRLVSDPRSFTISELRIAFEAYLSAPHPGRPRKPHKIDSPNFHKRITEILMPTNQYAPSRGRPGRLYRMPSRILDPANAVLQS